MSDAILPTADELARDLRAAESRVAELEGLMAGDPDVIEAHITKQQASVVMQHWAVRVLAASLAATLGDSPNFVTTEVYHPDIGKMQVTVKRKLGKEPEVVFLERAELAEAKVQELEAENARLRAVVVDADILFGAGWQEFMKSVAGLPHEAAHRQVVKLAGDVAILHEEKTKLEQRVKELEVLALWQGGELTERSGSEASRYGLSFLERVLAIPGWQVVMPVRSAHLTDTFHSGPYDGPCEILAESDICYMARLPDGCEVVTPKECVKEVLSS